jgi:hypothetical protein
MPQRGHFAWFFPPSRHAWFWHWAGISDRPFHPGRELSQHVVPNWGPRAIPAPKLASCLVAVSDRNIASGIGQMNDVDNHLSRQKPAGSVRPLYAVPVGSPDVDKAWPAALSIFLDRLAKRTFGIEH